MRVSAKADYALRALIENLLERGERDALIETVLGMIEALSGENRDLSFRLQKALKALYGRRSERISTSELQLVLQGLTPAVEATCPPPDT